MKKIVYIKNKDLQKEAYDDCILNSTYPVTNALSWFLDIMCDQKWDVLAYEDYSAVFPLPFNYRLLLPQIIQPPVILQLGLFAKDGDIAILNDFINSIPFHFIRCRLSLNKTGYDGNIVGGKRNNYYIDLNQSYEKITAGYSKDLWRNLKKTGQETIRCSEEDAIEESIELYEQQYRAKYASFDKSWQIKIKAAMQKAAENNNLYNYSLFFDDVLLCRALLLQNQRRIQYVYAAPTKEGLKLSIMHRLIDTILQKHSNQNRIFSFEGSMLPNVASFYKKFGPEKEHYHSLSRWF